MSFNTENFKSLMTEDNLSINEVANRTGLTRDTVRRLRTDPLYNPSLRTLDALCKVFKCSVTALVIDTYA